MSNTAITRIMCIPFVININTIIDIAIADDKHHHLRRDHDHREANIMKRLKFSSDKATLPGFLPFSMASWTAAPVTMVGSQSRQQRALLLQRVT